MEIITSVFDVFGKVADWIIETLPKLGDIFYTTGGDGVGSLTILGVLAVASLGIGVTMLLFNYVKDLLTFR